MENIERCGRRTNVSLSEIESKDKKVAVVQYALEKYIASDTTQSPNYRRGARVLQYNISSATWNDLTNNSLYYLNMIYDALSRLNDAETPNFEYENMLAEVNDWIEKEE